MGGDISGGIGERHVCAKFEKCHQRSKLQKSNNL